MGLRSLPFFKAKKGWQFAGGGLPADGGGGGGTLPIATSETLGGVRVGTGLNVANDGTISVPMLPYSYDRVDTGAKWVDGKTIYKQTFVISNVRNGTGGYADIAGMDMFINYEGFVLVDGFSYPLTTKNTLVQETTHNSSPSVYIEFNDITTYNSNAYLTVYFTIN